MQYLSVLSVWDRQTGRWRVVIAHSCQKINVENVLEDSHTRHVTFRSF